MVDMNRETLKVYKRVSSKRRGIWS